MPIQTIDRGTAGDTGDKFRAGLAFDTCQANDDYLELNKVGTVATFAALASTPATVGQIVDTICHTSGTKGAVRYKAVSEAHTTTDYGTHINSATTGIRWRMLDTDKLSPYHFGSNGLIGTDSTTAITRCVAACGLLKQRMYPGTGNFLISSTVNFDFCTGIVGEGALATLFVVAASMGAATDVFTVIPTSFYGTREGYLFSDFRIAVVAYLSRPARYGIKMTGGVAGGDGIGFATIERVRIDDLGTYGIYTSGVYSSVIQNNYISGIEMIGNDNHQILNNTLFGRYWGCYFDAVTGSNQFNFRFNTVISAYGGLYCYNSGTCTIADNQFEAQEVSVEAKSSMIVLEGNREPIYNTQITGNNFNCSPAFLTHNVRLYNTIGVMIYGNTFSGGTAYPNSQIIKIETGSYGTVIGHNFYFSSGSGSSNYTATQKLAQAYTATYEPEGRVVDLGVGTCGVWKYLDYTAYANTTRNANYYDLCVRKDETDTFVMFRGGVNVAAAANGNAIADLPVGFRPDTAVGRTVMQASARDAGTGAYYPITVFIAPSGVITMQGVGFPPVVIDEIIFDGCFFTRRYT